MPKDLAVRTILSGAATDGQVLTADGAGNSAWEAVAQQHAALTLGANPGLVLSTQELVLGTPSTLTVATTNAVSGTGHTHAITASAAPGAVTSLLKTDGDGFLTTVKLTSVTGLHDHIGEATGAHGVTIDNTLTLPASTLIPDGGTIGQAAGPLLTFDDTNNDLTLTGAKFGIRMDPAVELDVLGSIRASGLQNANRITSHNVSTGVDVICSINNSRGQLYTNGAYPLSFGANGTLALEVSTTGGVIVGTGYVLQDPGANNLTVQGSLAIGAVVPTARLFLPAGSATASTAPLKMTSGTLLTTAEAGAVEFLTDDYFATITTGAARKGVVLDDGARLTDGRIPEGHTNGRLIDTTFLTTGGFIRSTTANYRRYYHLPLGSANPGASGPTWVAADANTTGGWRLDAASERLRGQADVHADWDGEDLTAEIHFAVNVNNTGGLVTDTVDLRLNIYYKGDGDTATKTQAVEVATVIGQSAQYKQFTAVFTIDHDAASNVVEAGDILSVILNLETDTSEVDDIIVTAMEFYYSTTHIGIESGDA